jgi:hypothetical protein
MYIYWKWSAQEDSLIVRRISWYHPFTLGTRNMSHIWAKRHNMSILKNRLKLTSWPANSSIYIYIFQQQSIRSPSTTPINPGHYHLSKNHYQKPRSIILISYYNPHLYQQSPSILLIIINSSLSLPLSATRVNLHIYLISSTSTYPLLPTHRDNPRQYQQRQLIFTTAALITIRKTKSVSYQLF